MEILLTNPALKAVITDVAEVAGHIWTKGWGERNGGNITVNITEFADASWQVMPALVPAVAIGCTLPQLKGKYFYAKGTQKRMRDLARFPMANGSIIRITDDCAHYEIIADCRRILWCRTICLNPAVATRLRCTPILLSW